LKVIVGYNRAKQLLTRQGETGIYPASPILKKRLIEIFGTENPETAVRQIIDEVRRRGDAALYDYTQKIDGIRLQSLEVGRQEMSRARRLLEPELVSALELAAQRIANFHRAQHDGILSGAGHMGEGTLLRPLEKVGVYAPGGTATYPSTVLMTVIPARVAGVGHVILVTPSGKDGLVPAAMLTAADIAGVDRVFSVGGAQAVAALALGTESVPRVDKVCGPGNIFVMLAKKLVCGMVDIDGLQGPSEVLIIADRTAKPKYVAAEMLAQAEHDALASAVLITTSKELADETVKEVDRQLQDLGRRAITEASLESGSLVVVVKDMAQAIELSNSYAPEHLVLEVEGADNYVEGIKNAGCIFIGERPTVAIGDYVAGPSHALPTGGTARFSSPLNITDFVKYMNLVVVNRANLKELGPAAITIARAEGLEAHARAVEERLNQD
jgi:histidinol dehydrogenase